MKIIKHKIASFYGLMLTSLLYLMGFSTSCHKEYGSPEPMYGAVVGKIINGTIKSNDSTNTPIKNIRISFNGSYLYSNIDGFYELYTENASNSYNIIFEDIDGLQNGSYNPLDTFVNFTDTNYINLNIKLTPKNK